MEISSGRGVRTGCGCWGCLSTLGSLAVGLVITVVILGAISSSHVESDKAAISAFAACPTVTRALGQPLERVVWSPGCGEYEGGSGRASSEWTIRVSGPKGSASGWYSASHNGGPWVIHTATLNLPDGTVNAVPCPDASRPDAPKPSRPRPAPAPKKGKGGKRRGR